MGGKIPKNSDRRVQRTRRTLREALITLVLERGWEGFSVQEVCDRADVGRSTFYTHFADKEDLLIGGLDDLRKGLRALAAREHSGTPFGFARGLIDHAAEQQRLFRAVVGKRSGQVVQQKFRSLVLGMVQEDLAGLAPAGPRREAAAHYFTGALLEVLTWWLEARTTLGPEEIERLFRELAEPALAALLARR